MRHPVLPITAMLILSWTTLGAAQPGSRPGDAALTCAQIQAEMLTMKQQLDRSGVVPDMVRDNHCFFKGGAEKEKAQQKADEERAKPNWEETQAQEAKINKQVARVHATVDVERANRLIELAKARNCKCEAAGPRYLLEFQSEIISKTRASPAQSRVYGQIPLFIDDDSKSPGEVHYHGQGSLTYQTTPLDRAPCESLIQGSGTTLLIVYRASIKVFHHSDGSASAPNILLVIGIESADETRTDTKSVNMKCVLDNKTTGPYNFWEGMFMISRLADTASQGEDSDGYQLKDWTYVGRNGVVATKTFRGNCRGRCEEISTFTIKEDSSR